MKEEKRRYLLVEYAGTQQRVYDSKAEVDAAIAAIKRANDRVTEKYLYGNIFVTEFEGKFYMNVHLYHRLSQRNTISAIDGFTKNFSKSELLAFFMTESIIDEGLEPDINVAYLETRDVTDPIGNDIQVGVKYIPVLYREDVPKLDENYIKAALSHYANRADTDFFRALGRELWASHQVKDIRNRLLEDCDAVDHKGFNPLILYHTGYALYKRFVEELNPNGTKTRDENGNIQISTRRKRDFAFFVMNYKSKKPNSPFKYNGSTTKMRKQEFIRQRDRLLQEKDASLVLKQIGEEHL